MAARINHSGTDSDGADAAGLRGEQIREERCACIRPAPAFI
jgi:hypothetical protein